MCSFLMQFWRQLQIFGALAAFAYKKVFFFCLYQVPLMVLQLLIGDWRLLLPKIRQLQMNVVFQLSSRIRPHSCRVRLNINKFISAAIMFNVSLLEFSFYIHPKKIIYFINIGLPYNRQSCLCYVKTFPC